MKPDFFKAALEYAFLLLKFRPRSEYEMRARLKKKNFSSQAIEQALSFLKDRKFIDDTAFARAWTQDRLKRPFGLRRISLELRKKGISPKIIEESFKAAREGYAEDEVVREIVRERSARLKGLEPERLKRRLYGYLARRGFSPEAILEALNNL